MALLSGDETDSEETQAQINTGALIVADALHELNQLRRLVQALVEGLSK